MPVGSFVKGKVSKITGFGVFVQLENEITALIHVNDLSSQPIGKIENFVKVGEEIEAIVTELDSSAKKISLSMKDINSSKDDIIVKRRTKICLI